MDFPHWVDGGRLSKKKKAANRLKYVVGLLAAQHTERRSMRALAKHVGLDHSTLCNNIRRGAFSANAAYQITQKCGTDIASMDFLMNPLMED